MPASARGHNVTQSATVRAQPLACCSNVGIGVGQQMDGGDRQFAGIEPRPGVSRVAVDRGLQVDLADALECADEEGVDGDEPAGVRSLDVALAGLRREAFERPGLLLGEFDLALQPQQALMLW